MAFVVALVVSARLGRSVGMLGVGGCWHLCPYAGLGKLHMCVAVVGRSHCAQWCLLQALACGWGLVWRHTQQLGVTPVCPSIPPQGAVAKIMAITKILLPNLA